MTVKEKFDQHVEESWRKIEEAFTKEERESFHRIFLTGIRVGAICASVAIAETLEADQKLWKRRRTVKQVADCHTELTHAIEEEVKRIQTEHKEGRT